jgi:hypothetical protein
MAETRIIQVPLPNAVELLLPPPAPPDHFYFVSYAYLPYGDLGIHPGWAYADTLIDKHPVQWLVELREEQPASYTKRKDDYRIIFWLEVTEEVYYANVDKLEG